MSYLQKYDILNNQFTLRYYFQEQNLNDNIFDYMENNNIKNNYVCFFDTIDNTNHFLVTTDIVRDPNNGYRLIKIVFKQEIGENRILQAYDIWKNIIEIDNVTLYVSNKLDLLIIEKMLNVYCSHLPKGIDGTAFYGNVYGSYLSKEIYTTAFYGNTFYSINKYSKDTDNMKLTESFGIPSFRLLSVLPNIIKITTCVELDTKYYLNFEKQIEAPHVNTTYNVYVKK
jgi:hypothetical protein